MHVIQPYCRDRLTADDLDLIIRVFDRDSSMSQCLVKLLTDSDSRDIMLDDRRLFTAIIESPRVLRISYHLYFYVLVRNAFMQAQIDSRDVADYVASVLAQFTSTENVWPPSRAFQYVVDIMAELESATDGDRFALRAHAGNLVLFMSGMFVERIRARRRFKAAPDVSYYEDFGRSSYDTASDHRLAEVYQVADIYRELADNFPAVRLALNDMAERLMFCGTCDDEPLDLGTVQLA